MLPAARFGAPSFVFAGADALKRDPLVHLKVDTTYELKA